MNNTIILFLKIYLKNQHNILFQQFGMLVKIIKGTGEGVNHFFSQIDIIYSFYEAT